MSSRPAYLVPSDGHVEVALAQGRLAFTFGAFLDRLTAGLDRRPAPREVTRLATAVALEDLREWDGGDAFVLALDDAVGAARRAGLDARAVRQASGPRAALVARLLERTDEMLRASGLFDDRAKGWAAAEALDGDRAGELPSKVVVEGLFRFDAAELAWVEALARRTAVTVRVPRSSPDALLSTLEGRWHALERPPDLELFELRIPADVTLVAATTEGAEARAVARAVSDAVRAGTPAERIAIVVPDDDETFLDPLAAALDEARVPFYRSRRRFAATAPAVSAALAWLDLAAGPLYRDTLLDLLRTRAVDPAPFVDGATAPLRRRRALSLAARLAKIPVRADREGTLLGEVLAAEIAKDADDGWMLGSLARMVAARTDLARDASRSEIVGRLSSMWRQMGLVVAPFRTLAALAAAEPASREGELLAAQVREHAEGLHALVEAAHRVAGAADTLGVAGARIPIARFRAELQAALEGAVGVAARRPACVRVTRASDVARLETELLVVTRANEGILDRAEPGDGETADRLSLRSAIDGARRLVVTRSTIDAEGRPRSPAALFVELAPRHAPAREPGSRVHPTTSTLSPRGAELCDLAGGAAPGDDDLRRRVAIEQNRLDFFLDPRMPAARFTGAIEDAAHREALRLAFGGTSAKPIAATAIERAAQCRFSAFAGAVLGASSTDVIGEGLEPWQRGSLVHRALLVALETVRRRAGSLGARELVELASATAKKAIVKDVGAPLFRAEVERALRAVAAVVEWSLDDDFRFAHGERSFGENRAPVGRGEAPWPALVIGAAGESVHVKGRIDRVDFSTDGSRARVIDYKTGTLPAWKDVGSVYFQPPLYASVVLAQMGRLSVPEVRSLYLDTSRRPPRTLPMEKNQVFTPDAMRESEQRAANVVVQLWNGKVAPRPADAAICGRCDARDICRRPAAMPVEELDPDADAGGS
jgi:hypothetical protein